MTRITDDIDNINKIIDLAYYLSTLSFEVLGNIKSIPKASKNHNIPKQYVKKVILNDAAMRPRIIGLNIEPKVAIIVTSPITCCSEICGERLMV